MHLTVVTDPVSAKALECQLVGIMVKPSVGCYSAPLPLQSYDYIKARTWIKDVGVEGKVRVDYRRGARYRVVSSLFIAYLTVTDLARFLG
jgi:hypothetical protein